MVIFPPCKINIGLRILRKRPDGYHDLETVFYPVALKDAAEIIEQHEPSTGESIRFSQSGLLVDGNPSDNLCVKAYHLLKKDFPSLPAIKLHLHKNIPMGAGLGGGSSDAASVLLALNEKFDLKLSQSELINYALQLGSDCPFFILNKPCIATGRGELMKPLDVDLSGYRIIIVHPGIHVNTGWAFSTITPKATDGIEQLVRAPIETWSKTLINDFEEPVFNKHPEIGQIKHALYGAGALYASMSGSGSSVYGIFRKGFVWEEKILDGKNVRVDTVDTGQNEK